MSITIKQVPKKVMSAYSLRYNKTENEFWILDKGKYSISFEIDKKNHVVTFDRKGLILKELVSIDLNEIPRSIFKVFDNKSGYHIHHLMVDKYKNPPLYSVLLDKDNKKFSLKFEENGNLVEETELS